ncbi:hypothetical protein ACQ4PT_016992 [Festuca glaucescens]
MFDDDDDDDDVDPGFNVVDKYYFEDGDGDPVCFSVLPLKFGEIGEVACLDSKKVHLQGLADGLLHKVHKEVVAWRVGLDNEQPKILALSSEGKWIELLKPRKCYENTVRSILITVQMLHFVRRWPRKRKTSLLDHLSEVFSKFDTKPSEYDLKKHRSIIKLFAEKDPTLMKSKILQMFTENTSRNIREAVRTKEPIVMSSSDDEEDLDNDSDDDYSGQEDNRDADYSCDDDDSDDQDNDDDKSNDDYSCNDDDSDDDGDIGNVGDDDGEAGTDNLCAICDNGGKLLSCVGQCKRAFHPREKDGTESNCETLGLTTAQLKEIDHYLCKNCEYKQHQCFSCGDLEPSDGPNAKVFQCYKASCGHFYHPSCIAKLLEPDDTDGACMLEKKIAAGMSFTCPAHWCSKCGKMEDSAKVAQWLAVCRRCPVSYHKKCLPSDISFESKRGRRIRAWQLDDRRVIIYCGYHKLEKTTGTPRRDHVKLPSITETDTIGSHCMDHTPSVAEINRTRDLSKKKAKVTGKRKLNTNQGSTGTTEMSNKLCREEADQTQKVATNNSREHISREGRGVLKNDTTHLNLAHNDEQNNYIVEGQAEGDKNNTKSGKEKETHRVENAYEHDLILEKEKIPEKGSNKSGLTIGGFASGHVDGRSREKLAHVKTTTSNRIGTQQDSEWDGDQQVDGSYAGKQELNNPQCNGTHKATEIDTSGDKSRMRQEHKEQATDRKILNLERNRDFFYIKTERDDCRKAQDPQCLRNHEPDALDYKLRSRDLGSSSTSKSHPRNNDDQSASKTELRSRDGRGSGRKEWRNNVGVNSYRGNSPSERRHPQKKSRVNSPEGRRMDYDNYHPRSNDQHNRREDYSSDADGYRRRQNRREDYSSDGGGDRRRSNRREDYFSDGGGDRRRPNRREDYSSDGGGDRRRSSRREDYFSDGGGDRWRPNCREDYSSDGGGDRRMLSHREDYCGDGDAGRRRPSPRHSDGDVGRRRLSPRQSEFSPPASYPTRTEYGGRRRHDPPSYDGRHDPYMNSRESEHVNYAMDQRGVPFHGNPPNVLYHEYTDLEYGRHNTAPVDRYPLQEDSTGFYGGHFSDYGEGSGYRQRNRLNLEDRALSCGPVTEKYALRLDLTNHHPVRRQGGLPDAGFSRDAW